MQDTPVVCFLVTLFAGIIMVMLSRLTQTREVTVYKYLPRDLDTWLRETPNASVSSSRLFSSDDWTTTKAAYAAGLDATAAPSTAPAVYGGQRATVSGGLFAGMSHTPVPGASAGGRAL